MKMNDRFLPGKDRTFVRFRKPPPPQVHPIGIRNPPSPELAIAWRKADFEAAAPPKPGVIAAAMNPKQPRWYWRDNI
jgi:hypothetical protein